MAASDNARPTADNPFLDPNDPYQTILDHLSEGVYVVDRDRMIVYWNAGAARIAGYTADEVVGTACWDNLLCHINGQGLRLCFGHCPLSATMEDGQMRMAEIYLRHKDGYRVPVSVRAFPLRNREGAVVGAVESFVETVDSAVSLRIRELERVAWTDPLLEVANRRFLEMHLASLLEEHRRYGTPFGVLFIDLDGFKAFNDIHGHTTADQMLKAIGKTLLMSMRPFDMVGRWGGEEFLILVRHIDEEGLQAVAERTGALVRHTELPLPNEPRSVTASIGATLSHREDGMDTLIQRADALMYASKAAGRDRCTLG